MYAGQALIPQYTRDSSSSQAFCRLEGRIPARILGLPHATLLTTAGMDFRFDVRPEPSREVKGCCSLPPAV